MSWWYTAQTARNGEHIDCGRDLVRLCLLVRDVVQPGEDVIVTDDRGRVVAVVQQSGRVVPVCASGCEHCPANGGGCSVCGTSKRGAA